MSWMISEWSDPAAGQSYINIATATENTASDVCVVPEENSKSREVGASVLIAFMHLKQICYQKDF